jgi:hypothetical protein
MPARRKHYPGRGPATGISGTRRAYDLCAGCGHARVKHLTGPRPGCSAAVVFPMDLSECGIRKGPGTCLCPGYTETEG